MPLRFIDDFVWSLVERQQKARRAADSRAPFKDPQTLDQFLADLQYVDAADVPYGADAQN